MSISCSRYSRICSTELSLLVSSFWPAPAPPTKVMPLLAGPRALVNVYSCSIFLADLTCSSSLSSEKSSSRSYWTLNSSLSRIVVGTSDFFLPFNGIFLNLSVSLKLDSGSVSSTTSVIFGWYFPSLWLKSLLVGFSIGDASPLPISSSLSVSDRSSLSFAYCFSTLGDSFLWFPTLAFFGLILWSLMNYFLIRNHFWQVRFEPMIYIRDLLLPVV